MDYNRRAACMKKTVRPMILALIVVMGLAWPAAPAPAPALDETDVADLSPETWLCMEKSIGKEKVAALKNGELPTDKKGRKKLSRALESCAGSGQSAPSGHVAPYAGPLFDAMSQIDGTVDMDAAMDRVRQAGVTRLGLFARSHRRLHEEEADVLDLARKNPDLVVLGAPKYFLLDHDLAGAYIRATLDGIREHGYRFIGEILYTHGDKKSGKQYASGERYVDPTKPGTARLLEAIAPLHIPLMTHWEPYAPDRDFPRFHALYDAWPDQIFVVPHMGFASPGQVEEFMSRHPNLHMIISKKERSVPDFSDPGKEAMTGSSFLDNGTLRPEWKEILIRYQDRLIFGTDPHMNKLWLLYPTTIRIQRLVLGQLPPEAAEKIAHKNAEKLYGVGPTPVPSGQN